MPSQPSSQRDDIMSDERSTVATPTEDVLTISAPDEARWRQSLPKPLRFVEVTLRTFQILGMAIVVALMLLTVAHVVGRYLFDFPMLGVVEISGLMVITLVFFAAPYDFFIDRHIAVDVIVRRLPPRLSLAVNCFTYLVTLVVVTLAMVWTIKKGEQLSASGSVTDMLRIPIYPFYFVVALGWLISMIGIIARLVRFFLEARSVRECEAVKP
jgi:TRAP-type C4-dicarboxylate transport system permease small subunit